jgi:hypothetical protein
VPQLADPEVSSPLLESGISSHGIRRPWHARSAANWAAAAIILIGVLRIVSTYSVFTQTYDEPAHIACGLQLLTTGHYDFEPQHPPLARVFAALPLYVSGIRTDAQHKMWDEGNHVLAANGAYTRNLAAARAGVLPFYIIACVFVFLLARTVYGTIASLVTLLLFSTLPLVLAHAGLATTDMAVTAGFVASTYFFLRWQRRPSLKNAFLLGAVIGVAVLTKFSFLPFFAITACVFYLVKRPSVPALQFGKQTALAAVVTLFFIWAGYGFTIRPFHPAFFSGHSIPLPLTDFARGIAQLVHHLRIGHPSYLLGHTSTHGFAWYFPVALAVKLPIAFLLLVSLGFWLVVRSRLHTSREVTAAAIAAVLVVLSCVPSTINIGLRHLLPIMTLLSLVAAYPLEIATRSEGWKRSMLRAVFLVLVAWQLAVSIGAHPDYLAYFNEFAGKHPEHILVDSDLDWGQDLGRLFAYCERTKISALTLGYPGNADLSRYSNISVRPIQPFTPVTGWVAISKNTKQLSLAAPGILGSGREYSWLDAYPPVAHVGRSIDVYFIPEPR